MGKCNVDSVFFFGYVHDRVISLLFHQSFHIFYSKSNFTMLENLVISESLKLN